MEITVMLLLCFYIWLNARAIVEKQKQIYQEIRSLNDSIWYIWNLWNDSKNTEQPTGEAVIDRKELTNERRSDK